MGPINTGMLDDTGGGMGMLTDLPQQANPYADQQRLDPNRNLWAGTMMDIGAIFGNAFAGTGSSTGNAMRMYQGAKQHNQYLDQAGQQWEQQQIDRTRDEEDRQIQNAYRQAQTQKTLGSMDGEARAKPVGAPQKMADGSLAVVVQQPDGQFGIETVGEYANEGSIFNVAGVPYIVDRVNNTIAPVTAAPAQGAAPQMPPGAPQAQPSAAFGQPITPETVAQQEANLVRATEQAKTDVAAQASSEQKTFERSQQLATLDEQLSSIDNIIGSFSDINFGPIQGRLPGSVMGSEDDFFDSLASLETLKNSDLISGALSEKELDMLAKTTLDRRKSKEYNRAELQKVRRLVEKARANLKQQLGLPVETEPAREVAEDDLINKYLD